MLAAPDAPDDDAKAWEEWGFPLIERLMITPTGELKVGPPPLKDNGLPQVGHDATHGTTTQRRAAAARPVAPQDDAGGGRGAVSLRAVVRTVAAFPPSPLLPI